MSGSAVEKLGVACHRYGPGRLPGARRRCLGTGYACASTAVLATTAFVHLMVPFLLVNPDSAALFWAVFGLLLLPVVVPAAFVSGVATWRLLPDWLPAYGAVAGLVSAVATYCLVTVALVPILAYGNPLLTGIESTPNLPVLAGSAAVVGIVAFLLTFWVAVPAGVAGGYVYEGARPATLED
ncbi:hypothetical protein GCM10027435_27770 [Haloparvum alkalitolerans]|uniref:hypothetical protein n=1 Tax=Haloparvum alkalitolerans TaxID=1042953 RepID=UPI003CE8BD38